MFLQGKPNFAFAEELIKLALRGKNCLESKEVLACYR
jgi:hypothetical protein